MISYLLKSIKDNFCDVWLFYVRLIIFVWLIIEFILKYKKKKWVWRVGEGGGGYVCSGIVIFLDSISKKYWILNKYVSVIYD